MRDHCGTVIELSTVPTSAHFRISTSSRRLEAAVRLGRRSPWHMDDRWISSLKKCRNDKYTFHRKETATVEYIVRQWYARLFPHAESYV